MSRDQSGLRRDDLEPAVGELRDPSELCRISSTPTIGEIREHLQLAIEIEHATIPAYLTSLFSLRDGTNTDAAWVLRTVAVEEMLHMSLAANVLNAIGGRPQIKNPAFVPHYPTKLPHFIASPTVSIGRFSPSSIATFMDIERNWDPGDDDEQLDRYGTIGEFYEAIILALTEVCERTDESVVFTGNIARQIDPVDYYGSEGDLKPVTDLKSAIGAMRLIVQQGEGADSEPQLSSFEAVPGQPRGGNGDHYFPHLFRFAEVYFERYYDEGPQSPPNLSNQVDAAVESEPRFPGLPMPQGAVLPVDWDAVWPVGPNPKASQYPKGSAIRAKLDAFNRAYTDMLDVLDRTFNGEPFLLRETVPAMYQLKYLGQELCRTPSGDGSTTVGPSWEFVPR